MKINTAMAEFNSLWLEQNEIYRNAAKNFGISESVLWILYALVESGGGIGQSEIASRVALPKQTTNTAVKKLESDGVIVLRESASRRCKDVILTEKGRSTAERTASRIIKAEMEAMSELTPEEQEQFLKLFNKYNESLNKKIGDIK